MQQSKNRRPVLQLLSSSAAALDKWESQCADLHRAVSDSQARTQSLSQTMQAGGGTDNVKAQFRKAIKASEHSTADMMEAAERVQWAVDEHRSAHDGLATAFADDASGVEGPNKQLQHRMPAHPSETGGGVPQHMGTLRDAMTECRRVLKQAEAAFAQARSRSTDASSAVQGAVAAARKMNR